jgi:hypothetical protein
MSKAMASLAAWLRAAEEVQVDNVGLSYDGEQQLQPKNPTGPILSLVRSWQDRTSRRTQSLATSTQLITRAWGIAMVPRVRAQMPIPKRSASS